MKNLILTLLMIAGLSVSAQDEKSKDWMIGAMLPLPNTVQINYKAERSGHSNHFESYHYKSYPIGATVGYKGFTFGFYAAWVTVTRYNSYSNMTSFGQTINRVPNEDYWDKSYSLGYQYTFGKASDLLLKPIFGAHAIVHQTMEPGISLFDFAFDFGVRYKSVALLASVHHRTTDLDYQKSTFPMINVGNRKTYWSIKAQYYL